MSQSLFDNVDPLGIMPKGGRRAIAKLSNLYNHNEFNHLFSQILVEQEGFNSFRVVLNWTINGRGNRAIVRLEKKDFKERPTDLSLLKTPTMMDAYLVSGKKNPTSGDSGSLGQEILSGYEPTMEKLKLINTPISQGIKVCVNRRSVPVDLKLLPTPTVQDFKGSDSGENKNKQGSDNLRTAIHKLLPTPTTTDWNTPSTPESYAKRKERHAAKGVNLQFQLRDMAKQNLLPSPMATDAPDKNTGKRKQDGLQKRAFEITGETSSLNPEFVQEMMGFPHEWIIKPFLKDADK